MPSKPAKKPASEIAKFYGRKFRGKHNGKQLTIRVVDWMLGGDVEIMYRHHNSNYRQVWTQEKFIEFISTAKELTNAK